MTGSIETLQAAHQCTIAYRIFFAAQSAYETVRGSDEWTEAIARRRFRRAETMLNRAANRLALADDRQKGLTP